jgi:hypothetical protein
MYVPAKQEQSKSRLLDSSALMFSGKHEHPEPWPLSSKGLMDLAKDEYLNSRLPVPKLSMLAILWIICRWVNGLALASCLGDKFRGHLLRTEFLLWTLAGVSVACKNITIVAILEAELPLCVFHARLEVWRTTLNSGSTCPLLLQNAIWRAPSSPWMLSLALEFGSAIKPVMLAVNSEVPISPLYSPVTNESCRVVFPSSFLNARSSASSFSTRVNRTHSVNVSLTFSGFFP